MKEAAISCGNEVAVGRLGTAVDDDGPGASNAMPTMASWSSNVKDGKRRAMSLDEHFMARLGWDDYLHTSCTFHRGCFYIPAHELDSR